MSKSRCYVEGSVTDEYLKVKLDNGQVLTDLVRNGYSGGDVAYFRDGTPEEIEMCRGLLAKKKVGNEA